MSDAEALSEFLTTARQSIAQGLSVPLPGIGRLIPRLDRTSNGVEIAVLLDTSDDAMQEMATEQTDLLLLRYGGPDLRSSEFGRLTPLEFRPCARKRGRTKREWLCRCTCGSPLRWVTEQLLLTGRARSCGCISRERARAVNKRVRELAAQSELHTVRQGPGITPGDQFGLLTVVQFSRRIPPYTALWLCRCQCGVEREFRQSDLTCGRTKSCGCLRQKQLQQASREIDQPSTDQPTPNIDNAFKLADPAPGENPA